MVERTSQYSPSLIQARTASWAKRWQGKTVEDGAPEVRSRVLAEAARQAQGWPPLLVRLARDCDREMQRLFGDLRMGLYAEREAMRNAGTYLQELRILRATIAVALGRMSTREALDAGADISLFGLFGIRYPLSILAELKLAYRQVEELAGIRHCCFSDDPNVSVTRDYWNKPEEFPMDPQIQRYENALGEVAARVLLSEKESLFSLAFSHLQRDSEVYRLLQIHLGGQPALNTQQEPDDSFREVLQKLGSGPLTRFSTQPVYLRAFGNVQQVAIDCMHTGDRRTTFQVYQLPLDRAWA